MTTRAQTKRTIKLRQADTQGREFIKVTPRNKTNWASCNLFRPGTPILEPGTPPRPQYGPPGLSIQRGGGDPRKLLAAFLLAVFTVPAASFAFASLAAIAASGGEVVLVTLYSQAGQFLGFKWVSTAALKGFLTIAQAKQVLEGTGLIVAGTAAFLSQDTKTPEFANFNKPCQIDPGQGKF